MLYMHVTVLIVQYKMALPSIVGIMSSDRGPPIHKLSFEPLSPEEKPPPTDNSQHEVPPEIIRRPLPPIPHNDKSPDDSNVKVRWCSILESWLQINFRLFLVVWLPCIIFRCYVMAISVCCPVSSPWVRICPGSGSQSNCNHSGDISLLNLICAGKFYLYEGDFYSSHRIQWCTHNASNLHLGQHK
jgi:hypothetical protein